MSAVYAQCNIPPTWYLDADGDQWFTGKGITQCDSPGPGYTFTNLFGGNDCNDADPGIHPQAQEICGNNIDENCDGQDQPAFVYYFDSDNDGYGDANKAINLCFPQPPPGYVPDNGDCNDDNPNIHPQAPEICGNNIDENCDGQDQPAFVYYFDSDNDGFGDPNKAISLCFPQPPPGYVPENGDCNDDNPNIHPQAPEICGNNIDENCDGKDDPLFQYYSDADNDGYGNPGQPITLCVPDAPAGFVEDNTDCNDSDPTINAGEQDICGNGIDENCDGLDAPGYTFYFDADQDTYGNEDLQIISCSSVRPPGYVPSGLPFDCNDLDANIHPDAVELCNNIDDDCDGEADEACSGNIYAGGIDDGFSFGSVTESTGASIYAGGTDDGFDFKSTTASVGATIYTGGIDDGFSYSSVNANTGASIYTGGIDDGFAYKNTTAQAGATIYSGGIDDGFSFQHVNASAGVSIYAGGTDDGFAYQNSGSRSMGATIYSGGIDDGFTYSTSNGASIGASIYAGGIDDGFAFNTASAQSTEASIYLGGVGDGFAFNSSPQNSPNQQTLLIEFDARWQGTDVLTEWITTYENGIDHFEVERSADNIRFDQIGSMPSKGDTKASQFYELADAMAHTVNSNVLYYRLVTFPRTGEKSYSGVVILNKENGLPQSVTIFPNPTRDKVNVLIKNYTEANWKIAVFDNNGRQVVKGLLDSDRAVIDLQGVESGTYFIMITNENGFSETLKIIIQK